jgi:hypothetical protein
VIGASHECLYASDEDLIIEKLRAGFYASDVGPVVGLGERDTLHLNRASPVFRF